MKSNPDVIHRVLNLKELYQTPELVEKNLDNVHNNDLKIAQQFTNPTKSSLSAKVAPTLNITSNLPFFDTETIPNGCSVVDSDEESDLSDESDIFPTSQANSFDDTPSSVNEWRLMHIEDKLSHKLRTFIQRHCNYQKQQQMRKSQLKEIADFRLYENKFQDSIAFESLRADHRERKRNRFTVIEERSREKQEMSKGSPVELSENCSELCADTVQILEHLRGLKISKNDLVKQQNSLHEKSATLREQLRVAQISLRRCVDARKLTLAAAQKNTRGGELAKLELEELTQKRNDLQKCLSDSELTIRVHETDERSISQSIQMMNVAMKKDLEMLSNAQQLLKSMKKEAGDIVSKRQRQFDFEASNVADYKAKRHGLQIRFGKIAAEIKRLKLTINNNNGKEPKYFDSDVWNEGVVQRMRTTTFKEFLSKERISLVEGIGSLSAKMDVKKEEMKRLTSEVEHGKKELSSIEHMLATLEQEKSESGSSESLRFDHRRTVAKKLKYQQNQGSGHFATKIRSLPASDRSIEEKNWVALDYILNPHFYSKIDKEDADTMKYDSAYNTSLSKAEIERLLTLPEATAEAMAFFRAEQDISAHYLLQKYTLDQGEDRLRLFDLDCYQMTCRDKAKKLTSSLRRRAALERLKLQHSLEGQWVWTTTTPAGTVQIGNMVEMEEEGQLSVQEKQWADADVVLNPFLHMECLNQIGDVQFSPIEVIHSESENVEHRNDNFVGVGGLEEHPLFFGLKHRMMKDSSLAIILNEGRINIDPSQTHPALAGFELRIPGQHPALISRRSCEYSQRELIRILKDEFSNLGDTEKAMKTILLKFGSDEGDHWFNSTPATTIVRDLREAALVLDEGNSLEDQHIVVATGSSCVLLEKNECFLNYRGHENVEFTIPDNLCGVSLAVTIAFRGATDVRGFTPGRIGATLIRCARIDDAQDVAIGFSSVDEQKINDSKTLGKISIRHEPLILPIEAGKYRIALRSATACHFAVSVHMSLGESLATLLNKSVQEATWKYHRVSELDADLKRTMIAVSLNERKRQLVKELCEKLENDIRQTQLEMHRLQTALDEGMCLTDESGDNSEDELTMSDTDEDDAMSLTSVSSMSGLSEGEISDDSNDESEPGSVELESDSGHSVLPTLTKKGLQLSQLERKFSSQVASLSQMKTELNDILEGIRELRLIAKQKTDITQVMKKELQDFHKHIPIVAEILRTQGSDVGHVSGKQLADLQEFSNGAVDHLPYLSPADRVRRKPINLLSDLEKEFLSLDKVLNSERHFLNLENNSEVDEEKSREATVDTVAPYSRSDLIRIKDSDLDELSREELHVRKILDRFHDLHPALRWQTINRGLEARKKRAKDRSAEEEEYMLYDRVFFPDLQREGDEGPKSTLAKDQLIKIRDASPFELFTDEVRRIQYILQKFRSADPKKRKRANKLANESRIRSCDVTEMFATDIDKRSLEIYQEIQRVSVTQKKTYDSKVLHGLEQRFFVPVLLKGLQAELDRVLLSQVFMGQLVSHNSERNDVETAEELETLIEAQRQNALRAATSALFSLPSGQQSLENAREVGIFWADAMSNSKSSKPLPGQALQAAMDDKAANEQIRKEMSMLGPGSCLACQGNCIWKPLVDVTQYNSRSNDIRKEIDRIYELPNNELWVDTNVLTSVKRGGPSHVLKADALAELLGEMREVQRRLRLHEVDEELHSVLCERTEFVEVFAVHHFSQLQDRKDAIATLERERAGIVGALLAEEIIGEVLDHMAEGWYFGELVSNAAISGFVPSIYAEGPLQQHHMIKINEALRRLGISSRGNLLDIDIRILDDSSVKVRKGKTWHHFSGELLAASSKQTVDDVSSVVEDSEYVAALVGANAFGGKTLISDKNESLLEIDRRALTNVVKEQIEVEIREDESVVNTAIKTIRVGMFLLCLQFFRSMKSFKCGVGHHEAKKADSTKETNPRLSAQKKAEERAKEGFRRRDERIRNEKTEAARRIRDTVLQRENELNACVQIQSYFRGHLARKAVRKWRSRRTEAEARHSIRVSAAITLQRVWRGYVGRQFANEQKRRFAAFVAHIHALEAQEQEEQYWKENRVERFKKNIKNYFFPTRVDDDSSSESDASDEYSET